MLNKNAITIVTPKYLPAEEYTLDQAIDSFIAELDKRVYTLYNIVQDVEEAHRNHKEVDTETYKVYDFIKNSMYKLDFYKTVDAVPYLLKDKGTVFHNYRFSINPKSVNFDFCATDIKERYIMHCGEPECTCSATQVEECDKTKKVWTMKYIPNWEDLFGKGEFPYINIVLFRLGNNEYYGAEFTR